MPGMPGEPGMPRLQAQPPAAVIRPPPRRSRPRRAGRPFNQPHPLCGLWPITKRGVRRRANGRAVPLSNGPIASVAAARIQRKPAPRRSRAARCCHVGLAGPGVRGAFWFRARRGRHGEQRRQPERREGDHGRCVTAAGQGRAGCEEQGTPGPAVGRAHGHLSWEEGRGLRLPKDVARSSFCFSSCHFVRRFNPRRASVFGPDVAFSFLVFVGLFVCF